MAAVLQVEPREGRPFHSSVKHLSAIEIDQMVHDYQTGVGSLYDLADIYGVHRTTIAQHLKRRGVRVGKLPLEQPEIEQARTLHKQGLSLNAIGRELRRDPKTVRAALR
ncbi:helix-turn-helix domain-containing protein [Parafrigoribacterium humi]|uniref:helix-turn-helix domain-containing protein n=1 Tax=Parafrigoribacterium humi TaxID=3144664 RepID=UPI0032EAEF29